MSDNMAGIIVFLMMAGVVAAFTFLCRFIASLITKRSAQHGHNILNIEENEKEKQIDTKDSDEFAKAIMGDPHYTTSIHFVE